MVVPICIQEAITEKILSFVIYLMQCIMQNKIIVFETALPFQFLRTKQEY